MDPYPKLPETRALLAVEGAASLVLKTQAAAATSAAGLKNTMRLVAVLQARLSAEQLAAVDAASAETWPDLWVRFEHLRLVFCPMFAFSSMYESS